ncbi:alpha/beta fold hydrolase [Cellvibrio japonicus]|uniref:Hydrolase, alpha/beta fold family n=1 Tax=Cellvibrio japonicus (strain Ueda107) TaxID=498211 RepID=B3PF51_CELJU|nr:alpha/beta hydrolase [Cellvibrio japonicus]ACE86170.1 hydrolase, alpha/beta fold family [Cellvibrio japonicus Ueda107]QEI13607.1 alpha/beta hydrolase [Cellvibrio japonicus]QEI17181.1 alpha/beta hydrolase [Cellvibrio japonicus]QEI20758.1 alpha/beta hydrolase [Cellvibrio japonicus]
MSSSPHPTADLIVLIHGWSCRASDWDATLSALASSAALPKCLAIELPGHGQHEHLPWSDWSIAGLARFVVDQLPESATIQLVGHSMGGCVALEAAAQLGERARQVILVDTFSLPYGDMDTATIDSIETPFREDFVAAMAYLVDNTTPSTLDSHTRDWIKTRMSGAAPEKMLPIWHNLLRWSPDSAFSRIQCPIHAINGEHIAPAAQDRCAPFVKARVLAGCHHFLQFEQPERFRQALLALLNEGQTPPGWQ